VKKKEFFTIFTNRQKVEKQHFFSESFNAEFGRELFLHIELVLAMEK
jgi:hypothetical protein